MSVIATASILTTAIPDNGL